MKACWRCGCQWFEKHTPGLRAECEECFSPLHACANCKFYAAGATQWCGEPIARGEKPRDPEMANSCSYFLFADKDGAVSREQDKSLETQAANQAEDWMQFDNTGRDALDRMFKPPDNPSDSDG
ncbi:MAG: hypothetical protein JXA52_00330 [Planctomycetes bacterium]|nr:hypothetical protein [Planctomycetota bacterium]